MMRPFRLVPALVLLPLMLAGCSALSALDDASQPLDIYELRTPDIAPGTVRRRNIEVVVEEPLASGALATERIMIRPGPLQAQYLPGVRWADPAPAMVQTLILRTLAESGAFASVGRRPVGSIGDRAILSELTDFQAETVEGTEGLRVSIRLMARLVDEASARVVASRTFAVSEDAPSDDPDTVVAAFDRAMGRLLAELVPWAAGRG